MKKVFACLLAVCMVLPALAGCSRPKETTAVRLSEVTHSVFYAPQYVALEQGFFGGVDFVASVHAAGAEDAFRRPQVRYLQQHGMLRVLVLLRGRNTPGQIQKVRVVEP